MTIRSARIFVAPSFRRLLKKRAADEDISMILLTKRIANKHKNKRKENGEAVEMFW